MRSCYSTGKAAGKVFFAFSVAALLTLFSCQKEASFAPYPTTERGGRTATDTVATDTLFSKPPVSPDEGWH